MLLLRRTIAALVVLALGLSGAVASSVLDGESAFAAPENTTTTLTASPLSPSLLGEPVTFTATVERPGAHADPTSGTVTFRDGLVTIGSGTVNASHQATFTTSALTLGAHSIRATFEGDAQFDDSSAVLAFAVKVASTTSLSSNLNPSQSSQLVTFTADVTGLNGAPTGSVTFTEDGNIITGCLNRPITAGSATCATSALAVATHSVTATYGGNSTYLPSTSPALSQVVDKLATSVALSSDLDPSTYGDPVTFTAVVSAPAGAAPTSSTVTFYDGVDVIGASPVDASAVATLTLDALDAGTHAVTATFAGDATYEPSTSNNVDQHVDTAATTTTITFVSNPSVFGEIITFTATVAPNPTGGTVQFTVDGTDFGAPVAVGPGGTADTDPIVNIAVGDHAIEAAFSGTPNYNASTGTLTQTVAKAATTTDLASDLNPSTYGDTVTFTATVTSAGGTPDGTVTFRSDGVDIAGCDAESVVGGIATCATDALRAATHSITADYSGSVSFNSSSAPPLDITVDQKATATTLDSDLTPAEYGDELSFTASVSGAPGSEVATGTVQFFLDGSPLGGPVTLAAGSASIVGLSLPAGSYAIDAVYSGTTDLFGSSGSATQVVDRADTATVVVADNNPSTIGDDVTFTATVSPPSAEGTVQFAIDGVDFGPPVAVGPGGVAVSDTISTLTTGDHDIAAAFSGNANLNPSSASDTITVEDAIPVDIAPNSDYCLETTGYLSGQICRLYQAFFVRDPDSGGLSYWMLQRARGVPMNAVADLFVTSPEFTSTYEPLSNEEFVALVYLNVLDRAPDLAGFDYWTSQLVAGKSRGAVMTGFSDSPEFAAYTGTEMPLPPAMAKVYRLYAAFFQREPDSTGWLYWTNLLNNPLTLAQIADSFATSPEFIATYGSLSNEQFVNLVYANVLQRTPDEVGFQYWLSRLEAGLSRGELMAGFSESVEFIVFSDTTP